MSDNKASRSVLHELERWQLEAREENSLRYFLTIPELPLIMAGDACYVIGRKGSGKTAIAEHIRSIRRYDTFTKSLSFKNFPFNDIYQHVDEKHSSPSQYITFWKYVIYSAICTSMAGNANVSPETSSALKSHFDVDFDRALSRSITKITQATGGLNILGSGPNGGVTRVIIPNEMPWINRVDALEQLILEHCDNSNYYVIFDELDEDYKDILDIQRKTRYFELLTSLLKAVSDVRRTFRGLKNVHPIIFLRDDIYEIIDDNDKNKWEDLVVNLTWTKESLEYLTAYRISKAIDPNGSIQTFPEAISSVFKTSTIRHGFRSKNRRHIFKHIMDRTLTRPRDIICYLRESARIANRQKTDVITTDIMREADRQYSKRFRREFVDEMHSIVPYMPDIFTIISNIRKQTFTTEEFYAPYKKFMSNRQDSLDFETVCRYLFHFSVIGNQPPQTNTTIFKYVEPEAEMNFNEKIIVHRGLLKSLQII